MFVLVMIGCMTLVIFSYDRVMAVRARDNNCMSNVKQLGLGLQMYAADNHYRLPLRADDWGAVNQYVKNTQIFQCPAVRTHPEPPAGTDPTLHPISDYLLNPTAQSDDPPETILAGDNAPGRHRGGRWFGVRCDGATAFYPASEWEEKLGKFRSASEGDQ
jgi:hypothetical protein